MPNCRPSPHRSSAHRRSRKAGLAAGKLDIYLSAISDRLDREVRTLTVFALIFMPATLISGIFGMNFRTMPLLDKPTGFASAFGLMVSVARLLGLIFRRRRWLG